MPKNGPRVGINAAELEGSPRGHARTPPMHVLPSPTGTRAQRRAYARLMKRKGITPPALPDTTQEGRTDA